MNITGIIAEFNPFHNGHACLLQKARELTGADLILVVMSGNFVQRGAPALLSKYARAEMALRCGADLVVELPVFCAAASAEYFAEGAVRLLSDLGVRSFAFGCEATPDETLPARMEELAGLLLSEPEQYRAALKAGLSLGLPFPAARCRAASECLPGAAGLLEHPNNLLGIEYIKACLKRKFSMKPVAVQRTGSGYQEDTLPKDGFPSARALRAIFSREAMPLSLISLSSYMPWEAYEILDREFFRTFPVTENDFSSLIAYQLLNLSPEQLAGFADVGSDLASRLYGRRFSCIRTDDFIKQLKTKEITYTRLARALFHIVLGITQQEQEAFRVLKHTPYARVLGMRPSARPYLKEADSLPVPLIHRPARARDVLSGDALGYFSRDIAASELYRQISYQRFQTEQPSEFEHEMLFLE